ncbi:MAG: hypothetical protein AAB134_06480 [Pseudomonadota bacterium]
MSAANLFRTFASRILPLSLLSTALIFATVPPAVAATKLVAPEKAIKLGNAVSPSPAVKNPSSAATGSLRILLVDDDASDNNNIPGDTRKSVSDTVFRKLVSDAVGGDAASWAAETVKTNANGPSIDKLRKYSRIIWYTGSSYGGNPDNTSVLSIEDEKTVRRYLEETGGAVVLISPGYASKVLEQGSTWEESSWPFLKEVLGIRGGHGLAQRFQPGTVTTTQGTKYQVGKGGAVESQFSAVNPGGANVVFTAELDGMKSTGQPTPVATAYSYGRGRIIYVGFTFENLAAKELAPAFQQLLSATGQNNTIKPVKERTVSTQPAPPVPEPTGQTAPDATEPNPKLTFTGLTYFKSAKVKIYTGNDNKEAPSSVTVELSVNGGESDDNYGMNPDRLVQLARFFPPKQEFPVNSMYESVMETSPGNRKKQYEYIQANSWGEQNKITLERCQQYGLRLDIIYEPNFILDAWKIDRVELEIDFGYWEWWYYRGDRELGSRSQQYLVSKPAAGFPRVISFNRSSLLNDANKKLTLTADGFFFPK